LDEHTSCANGGRAGHPQLDTMSVTPIRVGPIQTSETTEMKTSININSQQKESIQAIENLYDCSVKTVYLGITVAKLISCFVVVFVPLVELTRTQRGLMKISMFAGTM
jgi:hypothetical protein